METRVYHQKSKPRKCFIYKKADWKAIHKDLSNLNNNIETMTKEGKNVNILWNTSKTKLFESLEKNIPSKEIKENKNIPWIRRKEKKMIKKKQRLYKQATKHNKWTNYRAYQKECKRHLRKAESDYINKNMIEGLENNSTKPFWRYIKSKRQDSCGIAPLKKGTQLISDNKGKANLLIQQFKSVFTQTTDTTLPSTKIQCKNKIKPIIIKQEGLEKLLSKVNPSNSSGPDNIPNRTLKECAVQLAPILQKIFQVSIDTGDPPKDWRDSNISSIFKKGDKHLPENYRPVSLTSVPCKLLEHIICRHLMKHLETNRIQIRLLIRRITTTNNNK
jgi:hypothetical protein